MSLAELDFLGAHVRLTDTAFEWGSGGTTAYLATRCKRVVSVEHKAPIAAEITLAVHNAGVKNVSVLYVPPDLPYQEGGDDDGDLATFRSYIGVYAGQGVDVVLVDGRARLEVCRYVAERAPFGPNPGMAILLHDFERDGYQPIFEGPGRFFDKVEHVERLALLRMRND